MNKMLKPFLVGIALLRAILIFGGMVLFIFAYSILSIIVPHTKGKALTLRKWYLKYYCIPLLNIHIEKKGNPYDHGPAIYVCNHRSFSDPIVLCRYLKAFVIAKAEVKHYPIINKVAELTGVIWVNRQDKISRSETRTKLVETIQEGFNILVYPEGTVGTGQSTLPFKTGTFIEAATNRIPVIPVAIEYKSPKDLWVLEKFLPQYFYQFSKWRTDVKLTFGTPLSGATGNELHDAAYKWINQHLSQMQHNWSETFK